MGERVTAGQWEGRYLRSDTGPARVKTEDMWSVCERTEYLFNYGTKREEKIESILEKSIEHLISTLTFFCNDIDFRV